MPITPQQVQRLCAAAHVDEIAALAALERTGGDQLQALLDLESRGQTHRPARGGYYTTRSQGPGTPPPPQGPAPHGGDEGGGHPPPPPPHSGGAKGPSRGALWSTLKALWRGSLVNRVEVSRHGRSITSIPLLVVVVLLCCLPGAALPLVVITLVLGFRYRFGGPDLGGLDFNMLLQRCSIWLEELWSTILGLFKRS